MENPVWTSLIAPANIGICALRGTAANRTTDLHSFADVLVHLFLPLRPDERDVKTCLEATVYDFYACVRASKLEAALQVTRPNQRS